MKDSSDHLLTLKPVYLRKHSLCPHGPSFVNLDVVRATATAVYTQSLGELVPSLHGFRDFISFGVKTGKKIREGDKAILVSTVKKINRRVLVGERGYSKGSRRYRSYSQPSSSEEYDIDITSLLQAEADLYGEGTAHTSKDIGRRYFTCENADDGECHIWKWWDVAVTEELRDYQRQLREVKDQANDIDEKLLVKLEKSVGELAKKKFGIANGYPLVVSVLWAEEKDNVLTSSLSDTEQRKGMDTPGFVNLLNNQTSYNLYSPEPVWFSTEQSVVMDNTPVSDPPASKERRKWSLKEDRILISAWLNTSIDAVVGNEQKAPHFWKRIVEYYNSSCHLVGTIPRELGQCKQRWARINELVCKFVGSYEAVLREQRSG
ncbi:BnaC05g11390D [Brassica napus]|uniref:BnaC05g11390D protein n=2 Tax=Brassica napus TaxID=3708 RepID=A0A078HMA0_BRANA|nr:BnaC05g11390D [Brassica napus]